MKKRPAPQLSDEDADLFAREMADVTRLAPDSRARHRGTPRVSPPRAKTSAATSTALPKEEDDTADGSEGGFVAPGVDRRELRKLKRGDYSPTHRLDLHGQTGAEAVASVTKLMNSSGRHRCICIVHGRGQHSAGSIAVLRTKVREYLKHHPATLAFADAPRNDGGSGAVYVLLRR